MNGIWDNLKPADLFQASKPPPGANLSQFHNASLRSVEIRRLLQDDYLNTAIQALVKEREESDQEMAEIDWAWCGLTLQVTRKADPQNSGVSSAVQLVLTDPDPDSLDVLETSGRSFRVIREES